MNCCCRGSDTRPRSRAPSRQSAINGRGPWGRAAEFKLVMPRVVRVKGMNSIGQRLARVAPAIALASCVRYETVATNELDYPGACPKDTVALAAAVAETTLATGAATGVLVGVVIR